MVTDPNQLEMLQVGGGGGGRVCLVHCPGVGGLGCRSDGNVTGERG